MDRRQKYAKDIKKLVLVVDDEYINRQLLGFIIRNEYDVIYAENGEDALRKIRDNKEALSLILLDLLMPVMDGFEVIKTVREDEELSRIPIIVCTSEADAEIRSLGMGAIDFVKKPYRNEVVLARIRRIIELAEEQSIIEATEREALTGLYTKDYFLEYSLQLEKYHSDWDMDAVAIDIDHFQLVNELYGREYGDEILKTIAGRLMTILSNETDGYACRIEADKFFVFCRHMDNYEEVRNEIAEGLSRISENHRIRLRMGVYPGVDRGLDMSLRFDRAKMACDRIRNDYTRTVAYYDNDIHERIIYERRLINDFHSALERGDFIVYYQPKYDVTGDKPVLSSAEALIRWKHPELGLISPADFIPLFEKNGLIAFLDHYVWSQAAKKIKEWKDEYKVSIPVSVNVSRMDMYDPLLIEKLTACLKDNDISAGELYLEITESAYAEDSDQLIEVVKKLRELGFMIEMDDFGSGYSSLNMLTTIPIDVLKMDMKFIQNLRHDERNFKLIEMIIDIAGFIDVKVIAEGVEDESQVGRLKEAGCDIIQGYYFSRPVPPEEFIKLFG